MGTKQVDRNLSATYGRIISSTCILNISKVSPFPDLEWSHIGPRYIHLHRTFPKITLKILNIFLYLTQKLFFEYFKCILLNFL